MSGKGRTSVIAPFSPQEKIEGEEDSFSQTPSTPPRQEEESKRKRKAQDSPVTPKKRSKRAIIDEDVFSRLELIERKLRSLDNLQGAVEALTTQLTQKAYQKEEKIEEQPMEESDESEKEETIELSKALKKATLGPQQLSKGYKEVMNALEAPSIFAEPLEHSSFIAMMAVKVERLEHKRNQVEAQRLMATVKAIYKGIQAEEIVARLLTRVYEIIVMESTGHEAANAIHGFVEGEDKECPNLNKIQETFKAAKTSSTREKSVPTKTIKKGQQKFGKGSKPDKEREKEKAATLAAKRSE